VEIKSKNIAQGKCKLLWKTPYKCKMEPPAKSAVQPLLKIFRDVWLSTYPTKISENHLGP
jgi:hypothetical protein